MIDDVKHLKLELTSLKNRLREAEQTINAIQDGEVDAIIVNSSNSSNSKQIYSLVGPEHPYQIFIETMNEAAVNLSQEGAILYCNESFAYMLNLPLEKIIGTSFWHFIEKKQQADLKALMTSKKEGKLECRLNSSNGEVLTVYLSFSAVNLKNMEFYCVLITDITEKQAIQQALETSNKKLEEALASQDYFLAGMSHNLRTPLNSILGFSTTLSMQLPGPLNKVQENQLKIIIRCSHQLLSLIDQLLDLSKLKKGNLQPVLEEIEINSLMNELIEEISPLVVNKKLNLAIQLLPESLLFSTDKRMFGQVILNLLDNAIKYTQKGSIRVALKKLFQQKLLQIDITDTGVGIKEEDLENIFEAYSKVIPSLDRYNEHTGLGLYLCRQFCLLLGIEIKCKSTINKGSTFTLLIPLQS